MRCSKCGAETNGNFCGACGTKVVTSANSNYGNLRRNLVDGNENIKAILGNDSAQTFAATGRLGNGFSILTDKRVYVKGRCLVRQGRGFSTKQEEKTVDLRDISGTGFVCNSALWAKILRTVFFVLAMVSFGFTVLGFIIISPQSIDEMRLLPYLLITFVPGLIFLALQFVFRYIYNRDTYSVFEITYTGGSISFDMRWINEKEAKEFQRQVTLLKQAEKEQATAWGLYANSNIGDINPQQIKQYKELLDEGVITQEEFEAKKKQLLGL